MKKPSLLISFCLAGATVAATRQTEYFDQRLYLANSSNNTPPQQPTFDTVSLTAAYDGQTGAYNFTDPGSGYQNIANGSPVEFRFYFAMDANWETLLLDNITVEGSVSPVPVLFCLKAGKQYPR